MKFLVESEIFPHAPVECLGKAFEETKAQAGGRGTDVRIECIYGVLGRRGAIAICEATSAESLHELLCRAPLFHFERFTITPLVSFEQSLTAMSRAAVRAEESAA